MKFPFYKQIDMVDCGPTCLKMILKYYGKNVPIEYLREICNNNKMGSSLLDISDAAEKIGFKTMGFKAKKLDYENNIQTPAILFWNDTHFVVLIKITKKYYYIADPAFGIKKIRNIEFIKFWIKNDDEVGYGLMLEPTHVLLKNQEYDTSNYKISYFLSYLKPFKSHLINIFIGMLVGNTILLILPFLTQAIIDVGLKNQDITFIYLVLFAQFILYSSSTLVDFIRGWVLLHLSAKLNIALVSDFLNKLLKLSVKYFDVKKYGDIIQRIDDNVRIESFLTISTFNTIFSVFSFVFFSIVLLIYNAIIFMVYICGTIVFIIWIVMLLKYRRELDYKKFEINSSFNSHIIQLISGIVDIKMSCSEKQKKWEGERLRVSLFKVAIKSMIINQLQQGGGFFINQTKNVIVSLIACTAVIKGEITLGMLFSIQFIIGQLNSPITQLIAFFQTAQEAKLSAERVLEIHKLDNENIGNKSNLKIKNESTDIVLKNVNYKYSNDNKENVLNNINMHIKPKGITAIVGASGSGKTTLLKIMLGLYSPSSGSVQIDGIDMKNLEKEKWRSMCGFVTQDSFVFNDTIEKNIVMGDYKTNTKQLKNAIMMSELDEILSMLPRGLSTMIGIEGLGLSQGQKQRILIARAIYKNPEYIFFDEATNSLDSETEKKIFNNLTDYFKERTTIIVSHRLSTILEANEIIVMDKGKVTEVGKHDELITTRGNYYNLFTQQINKIAIN